MKQTRLSLNRGWLALSCLAAVPGATAQMPIESLAEALRHRVGQDQVILRGYSAGPAVHARVQAGTVSFDPTPNKSFTLIHFDKVSVSDRQIRMSGTERYLLLKGDVLAPLAGAEPIHLAIDVDPNITVESIPGTLSGLFFPDVPSALRGLSLNAAYVVPGQVDYGQKRLTSPPSCDCSQHGTAACPKGAKEQGWSHPVVLKQVDPILPPDLASGSFSSTAAMQVLADGHVGEVWMLHAPTLSVAEATFKAIHGYTFKPATCRGVPVESYIVVDNNVSKF